MRARSQVQHHAGDAQQSDFFDEYSVYDVQQCDFYRAVGDLAAAEGGCRRLYDA